MLLMIIIIFTGIENLVSQFVDGFCYSDFANLSSSFYSSSCNMELSNTSWVTKVSVPINIIIIILSYCSRCVLRLHRLFYLLTPYGQHLGCTVRGRDMAMPSFLIVAFYLHSLVPLPLIRALFQPGHGFMAPFDADMISDAPCLCRQYDVCLYLRAWSRRTVCVVLLAGLIL
jgi:hypothetical protein